MRIKHYPYLYNFIHIYKLTIEQGLHDKKDETSITLLV